MSSRTYIQTILFCTVLAGSICQFAAPVLADDEGSQTLPEGKPGKAAPVVFDLVLHKPEEIMRMLRRAEELATAPKSADRPRQIALVLHGPEINNFLISKYGNNRELVDLAAKLDAFNVVDIKMCNTTMNIMGVNRRDVPAFIEIVPYGPAEIERLQSMGFIKL